VGVERQMTNFKIQAWKYCGQLKKNSDRDPAFAVYAWTHRETIDKGDLFLKANREIIGGSHTAKLNKDDIGIKFKSEVIKKYGIGIEEVDLRKFYKYLEDAGLVQFELRRGTHVIPEFLSETEVAELGLIDDNKYDVTVSIRLTNEGVDFAEKNWFRIYEIEITWMISIFALIVSLFALGK
jgi:hypothetical protein